MPQPDERESLPEVTPEVGKERRILPRARFSLRSLLVITGLLAIILSLLLTIDRQGYVRIVANPKFDPDRAEGDFPFSPAVPEFTLEVIRPVNVKGPPRIGFTLDPLSNRINVHLHNGLDETALDVLRRTKPLGNILLSSRTPISVNEFRQLSNVPMIGLVLEFPVTDEHVSLLAGNPRIESISFWRSKITDKSVDTLCTLPSLKKLDITYGEISDAGLANIARLKNLTSLSLFKCPKITDNGVGLLAQLQSLERLCLNNNSLLTGRCVKPLCSLSKLRRLELDGISIAANDCADLPQLKQLVTLGISNTGIDDAGLDYITQLPSLRSLMMQNTLITDQDLPKLTRLSGLIGLGLSGTAVSDIGVEHLASLKHLETLDVSFTKVTEEGLKQLTELTRLKRLNGKKTSLGTN